MNDAIEKTLRQFPQVIDYYIKLREQQGSQAQVSSERKVRDSHALYVRQFGQLAELLQASEFYAIHETTEEETRRRIEFFKDVVENKGGHRLFYLKDQPIRKEADLHVMFRLVRHGTGSDVSREVNDGRGPADFKISKGSRDKTIVEFKLASNSHRGCAESS